MTNKRFAHLNPKRKIYCFCSREQVILMLCIGFEGFETRFEKFWTCDLVKHELLVRCYELRVTSD